MRCDRASHSSPTKHARHDISARDLVSRITLLTERGVMLGICKLSAMDPLCHRGLFRASLLHLVNGTVLRMKTRSFIPSLEPLLGRALVCGSNVYDTLSSHATTHRPGTKSKHSNQSCHHLTRAGWYLNPRYSNYANSVYLGSPPTITPSACPSPCRPFHSSLGGTRRNSAP